MLMRWFRRVVWFCLLLPAYQLLAKGAFLVAPTHFVLPLGGRVPTKTMVVSNTGDRTIHLRVTPIFLKADSRSLTLGHSLPAHSEKRADLSPYIRVSPRAFSLRPGQEREVRMSIHAPHDLPKGAYRSHLLFHMIRPNQWQQTSGGRDKQAHSMALSLSLTMEMAISVYATQGQGQPHLTFVCEQEKAGNLAVHVRNDSPWRFEGPLTISNSHAAMAHTLDLVMLRDTQRKLSVAMQAKPGIYHLHWQAEAPYRGRGQATCRVK